MELSYETVRAILESFGWEWCSEYGEPGYETHGDTAAVVLGNYWCRCAKYGVDEFGRNVLHSYDQHWPKVWKQLEDQGVSFEWDDEWVIDYESDKAYRTQPDSYSWQPSLIFTEDGEMLTPDSDIEEWLYYAVNEPHRCLPRRVITAAQLQEAGFVKYNADEYESGWHPGQTDNPEAITREIREAMGQDVEIVFSLDHTGQFDIGFSVWTRGGMSDDLRARIIANQWHGGMMTAMYALASSGATELHTGDWPRILDEIDETIDNSEGNLAPELDWLRNVYLDRVGARGMVEGWSELHWDSEDEERALEV